MRSAYLIICASGLALGLGCSSTGSSTVAPTTGSASAAASTPTSTPSTTQESMSVYPLSVAVSIPSSGTASPSVLTVTPLNMPSASTVYIQCSYSTQAIASAVTTINGATASITLTFKSPSLLGIGTFQDEVIVGATLDAAGTENVLDSPVTVPVTFTVTGSGYALEVREPGVDSSRLRLKAEGKPLQQ